MSRMRPLVNNRWLNSMWQKNRNKVNSKQKTEKCHAKSKSAVGMFTACLFWEGLLMISWTNSRLTWGKKHLLYCRVKLKGSICFLYKWADTVFWFCITVYFNSMTQYHLSSSNNMRAACIRAFEVNLFTTIHDGNFRRHSSMNVTIKWHKFSSNIYYIYVFFVIWSWKLR